MTTNSKLPQLQVLDQEGPVMLAKFSGADDVAAVVDDRILKQLLSECRDAKAEAHKAGVNAGSISDLCATLESVLRPYMKIRNDYLDRIDIERERAEAEHNLQQAINGIETPPA